MNEKSLHNFIQNLKTCIMETQIINIKAVRRMGINSNTEKREKTLKYLRAARIYESRIRKQTNRLLAIAMILIVISAVSLFIIFE